jgi:prepilin-type N-terminal cleavage/methylation domain-containing protein
MMDRRPERADAAEAGFTLVEVLVALAIIATMAGAAFAAIAQDAYTRRAVRLRGEALLIAQSALDRAVAGERVDNGRLGPLAWHVERQAYGAADPIGHDALEEVTVHVDDDAGRPVISLSTVRIAG